MTSSFWGWGTHVSQAWRTPSSFWGWGTLSRDVRKAYVWDISKLIKTKFFFFFSFFNCLYIMCLTIDELIERWRDKHNSINCQKHSLPKMQHSQVHLTGDMRVDGHNRRCTRQRQNAVCAINPGKLHVQQIVYERTWRTSDRLPPQLQNEVASWKATEALTPASWTGGLDGKEQKGLLLHKLMWKKSTLVLMQLNYNPCDLP